jgi:hypothetical protein
MLASLKTLTIKVNIVLKATGFLFHLFFSAIERFFSTIG